MRSDDKPLAEILHKDQEENLSAAKKSLKIHRKAYMLRRTDLGGDVIDIIDDGKIIERHRSNGPCIFFHQETAGDLYPLKKWLCISDQYRIDGIVKAFARSSLHDLYPSLRTHPFAAKASKECLIPDV